MKIINLTCSNCNAPLEVPDGIKRIKCKYCDTEMLVDDENRTYTININHNMPDAYQYGRDQVRGMYDACIEYEQKMREQREKEQKEARQAMFLRHYFSPALAVVSVLSVIVFFFSGSIALGVVSFISGMICFYFAVKVSILVGVAYLVCVFIILFIENLIYGII